MAKVQIDIEAKTTGDANLQRRIDKLRETGRVTQEVSVFEMKLAEAYDRGGDSLREQLRLLKEHEQEQRRLLSSARKDWRLEKQELRAKATPYTRRRINEHILKQEKQLRHWERETEEFQGARREWEERKRPEIKMEWEKTKAEGAPAGGGVSMSTMMTQAGITSGPVGVAQAGVSELTRAGMRRMAGMSTLGKVGMGLGIGVALGAVTKIIQWFVGGIEISRQFHRQMLPFRAAMQQMGKDAEPMNKSMKKLSENLAESLTATIGMSREWARLGGVTKFTEETGAQMEAAVRTGKVWGGIDPQLTIAYTGQMARFGTYFNPQQGMTDRTIRDTIMAANAAGMGGLRRGEFIQQVLSTTQAAAGTAGVVNPQDMISFATQIAGLGEPFRGERGGAFAARIHAGLTRDGQSGIGFLATKRMLGEDATMFQIKSQQLKGLSDPENLRARWEFLKGISGGDLDVAAMGLSHELGMPEQLRMIYNPESVSGDKLQDSLVELLEAGKVVTVDSFKMTAAGLLNKFKEIREEYPDSESKEFIAGEMAKELDINREMLYTTREGFKGKSVIDELWGDGLTQQELTEYQNEMAKILYEDDIGFISLQNEARTALKSMTASGGFFETVTRLIQGIHDFLDNSWFFREKPSITSDIHPLLKEWDDEEKPDNSGTDWDPIDPRLRYVSL